MSPASEGSGGDHPTSVAQTSSMRNPNMQRHQHGIVVASSGSKMGVVRVGLGLLAMGDVARAFVSPTSLAGVSSTAPYRRGEGGSFFCRQGEGARGSGKSELSSCSSGGGFVASSGGVSSVRRRMRRRRVAETATAVFASCTEMAIQDHREQQQTSSGATAIGGSAAQTNRVPRRSAMASSVGVDGNKSAAPVPAGAEVGVGSPRRLGEGVNGGRGQATSRSGSGQRLGVIRSAEQGGMAAKKAKVKALYFRARDLLRSPSGTQQAINILKEALELDPRDGHSWLLLARSEEQRGEIEAAKKVFHKATLACPLNVHLWQSWGMLEDKFGNPEMARSRFDKGLKADPGNPFVCHAWGMMEQRDGDIERARDIFKSSRPKVALTTALGELEATRGNLKAAREVFQEGLQRLSEQKPLSPEANQWAGPGRKAKGWRQELEGPEEILLAWAKVEEKTGGDLDKAMELMERARDADPDNVKAHIERARFEMRRGNTRSARVILSEAADLDQREGELFNLWATLESREGNLDTALKIATAAIERFPQDKSLLQTMGTIHGKLEQHEEAIDCYRRSIAIRPAAPAYVAWALIVAKLAQKVAKDQSSKGAEDAATDEVITEKGAVPINGIDATTINDDDARSPFDSRALMFGDSTGDSVSSVSEGSFDVSSPGAAPRSTAAAMVESSVSASPFVTVNPASTSTSTSTSTVASPPAAAATATVRQRTRKSNDKNNGDGAIVRQTGLAVKEELGSYAEARRLFELGIAADPAHGPLYNAYGKMEARIGNVEHARDVYQRGIEARCGGMHNVWQGLGALEASMGNRDRAREIFLKGARESTEEASFLYHSLGSLELAAMRLEDARAAFVEGIGRYPKNTQLLLGAALAETKMCHTDEARDYFRRAVHADPSHPHAWQAWGLMEARLDNHEVARSLWENGLKANPTHGPMWQAYALMEENLGEPNLARKLFQAGLERCPEHVQLHQAWAVLEGKEGDLSLARKLVLDGLRVDPYHGALWTVYAIIEKQDGSDGKARKVLELGTRACPRHGPLYRTWGQIEFQAGNTADARKVFDRGLQACPTYDRLYYDFGDMEATMGNTEFLEELTERGIVALLGGGVSPTEIEAFRKRMDAYASIARFDATSDSDADLDLDIEDGAEVDDQDDIDKEEMVFDFDW